MEDLKLKMFASSSVSRIEDDTRDKIGLDLATWSHLFLVVQYMKTKYSLV